MQNISLAHNKKLDAIQAIKPVTSEIPAKMADLNDQMARDIATLNGRYTEKLKPIQDGFVNAQEQLFKKLVQIYGAKTLEGANKANSADAKSSAAD